MRFAFEAVRPEMQQYFVESDTNGTPVNRESSSAIESYADGNQLTTEKRH